MTSVALRAVVADDLPPPRRFATEPEFIGPNWCGFFAHSPGPRIEAGSQPENAAEQRALVRAGFRHEGVLRSAEFRDGARHDIVVFGRARDDPPSW